MYSYEIVFEHPYLTKGSVKKQTAHNCLKMTQSSECVLADNGIQAMEYAKERMEQFPDNELVFVARRHPIVHLLGPCEHKPIRRLD